MIDAVAQGNKVAIAVDNWLTTGSLERILYQPPLHPIQQTVDILDYAEARRPRPHYIPLEWRRLGGFTEVEHGLDEITAQEEARRCLRCDVEWMERTGIPIPVEVEMK